MKEITINRIKNIRKDRFFYTTLFPSNSHRAFIAREAIVLNGTSRFMNTDLARVLGATNNTAYTNEVQLNFDRTKQPCQLGTAIKLA